MPLNMRHHIYADHGQSMGNKVQVFQNYRYVLAFENNNVTDYVTEKIWNAFQGGLLSIFSSFSS